MKELIVRSQRVLTPTGMRAAAIHVRDGRIRQVSDREDVPEGAPVLDADPYVILPGVVDSHVHVNDPGRADWEGWETATRAAAAGGVTTLMDMPLNSIPATVTPEAVVAKLAALDGHGWVDVALAGGLVPANAAFQHALVREGVLAVKCFLAPSGVDEFPHVDAEALATGLEALGGLAVPLLVHAELPGPLDAAEARVAAEDPRRYATYLASRPKSAEEAAVERVIATAQRYGARAHVVHLSASTALPLVRRAKDEGVALTVETCPHYLTFAAEDIDDGATAFKCAPPIREADNREALWAALREGLIDQVVTDHSPAPGALKCTSSGDFMKAWGGISSLQLGLAAVWTEARARGVSLEEVSLWLSARPAALLGLTGRKGALVAGADADLVFFDPDAPFVVDPARLHHRHPITPYAARTLFGVVRRTILRGVTVFEDGRHVGSASGQWQRRRDAAGA